MSEKERTPKEKRLLKVVSILNKLTDRDFYGRTTVSFESGKAVNLKVEESYKVDE